MSPNPDTLGWLAGRGHPRIILVALAGAALGLFGGSLWLTSDPVGHGLGTLGLRLATLGVITLAFAVSGLVAFAVFERGFG